jgi:cysteine-rich repeat protein
MHHVTLALTVPNRAVALLLITCSGLLFSACAQDATSVESVAPALEAAGSSAPAVANKPRCRKRHHCPPVCGNAVVESGEACDDGNTTNGDGCSASCQLDDIVSTPGDDRAGYLVCTDRETLQTFRCGPGQGCCTQTGMHCAASSGECGTQAPFFDICDGPEDCTSSGRPCWNGKLGRICDQGTDGRGNACHTDADCIPNAPICSNGACLHTP